MTVFGRSRGCFTTIALYIALAALLNYHVAVGSSLVAAMFDDVDIAQKLGAMIRQINPREVNGYDLPKLRPPPNSANGWDFCSWDCLQHYAVRTGEKGQTAGVYEIEAEFKPLPGVTSSMMVWLFQNLHNDAVNALDGKTYPMYLVFHGVDHLFHTAIPADNVGVGTIFSWNEIPLTGCQYNRLSARQPWTCPQNRTGYVRSDPAIMWSKAFHTKVNMTLTRFDQGGIEFIAQEKNPFFGGDGVRTIVVTRHTWNDSDQGLKLKTQQWVGLMEAGSNTKYDTSLIAPVANMILKDQYLGKAVNIPQGNITAAAYMAVLHYTQEYGTLPKWLPKMYSGRGSKSSSIQAEAAPAPSAMKISTGVEP